MSESAEKIISQLQLVVKLANSGKAEAGGECVKNRRKECIRLDPEEAVCPEFDSTGIKLSGIPEEKMGVSVLDDCAQEHIQ